MNRGAPEFIENVTYSEISMGQSARLLRTLTLADIQGFAAVSGDTNPAHLNPEYAADTLFHGVIAHGMWGGALISALLGTQFPGPGTIYLEQALYFTKPVRIGDTLAVTVTVVGLDDAKKRVELDCQVLNQKGDRVLHGVAKVMAPTKKVRLPKVNAPQIQLFDPEARFKELLALGAGLPPVRCAVVHPCDAESLADAMDAARYGLIEPLLVGPEARIRQLAEQSGVDLAGAEILPAAFSVAAAELAAGLAAEGKVGALMKGSLPVTELMHAVLAQRGLRTGRRMSYLHRFDVPPFGKPLLITDAGLHIRPGLREKVDIVQNAIDFARLLGNPEPKVALLSAVESVTPAVPSTLDAAALCKMAERGQISGGQLDGPLAFDSAVTAHGTQKHPDSAVAGMADILAAPDLESGTMLVRQLECLAGATSAGLVLGARVPVLLTGRADGSMARVSSALLAKLAANAQS